MEGRRKIFRCSCNELPMFRPSVANKGSPVPGTFVIRWITWKSTAPERNKQFAKVDEKEVHEIESKARWNWKRLSWIQPAQNRRFTYSGELTVQLIIGLIPGFDDLVEVCLIFCWRGKCGICTEVVVRVVGILDN